MNSVMNQYRKLKTSPSQNQMHVTYYYISFHAKRYRLLIYHVIDHMILVNDVKIDLLPWMQLQAANADCC